ncbi:hypothetical protein FACS1894190_16250 [Spirochaetia bacterium]|nr:hypothetical protein FACS1894190_16250 [Spirochaetia bacterium]
MAKNFTYDGCRLNAKNIVMCKAYNTNQVIFENLPENHCDTYEDDIKEKIDPNIKWVLACPVWYKNHVKQPIGVVVIFGANAIVADNETDKIRKLENIALELSKVLTNVIS